MADAPRRMSPAQIAQHAERHRSDACPFEPDITIDFSKPFLCPSLTPLFYTPIWKELSPEIQLRYTQLSALSFNELIAWFEEGFSSTLVALQQSDRIPQELKALLPGFIEDERRHQDIWWALNRCTDPQRYARNTAVITRIAPVARTLMKWLASHPLEYPVAVWVMLILEEHGNEIARRCATRRPNEIEPHFAAAYLGHVRDETRHVQIDWHLIDSLWPHLKGWRRFLNVWLFRWIIRRLLFRTENAAISVAEELIRERPVLRPLLPRIQAELRAVSDRPEFRATLFSAESSPITFHLLGRFPELRSAMA
jgi:para-aminobenzoate N-oxygenase AurF